MSDVSVCQPKYKYLFDVISSLMLKAILRSVFALIVCKVESCMKALSTPYAQQSRPSEKARRLI